VFIPAASGRTHGTLSACRAARRLDFDAFSSH
jgi:hypothetical protein